MLDKKLTEAELEEIRLKNRLQRVRECGIPYNLYDATLDSYRVRSWSEDIVKVALRYIELWPQQTSNAAGLLITGSPGIGKSHIAAAIAREIILKGYEDVAFISVEQYLDDIKETFDDQPYNYGMRKKTKADVMNRVCSCSLLVFDDLMANSSTEWALNMIEQVYDRRMNGKRPTITTSNYSAGELQRTLSEARQERLVSRLFGCSLDIDLGHQADHRTGVKKMTIEDMLRGIEE